MYSIIQYAAKKHAKTKYITALWPLIAPLFADVATDGAAEEEVEDVVDVEEVESVVDVDDPSLPTWVLPVVSERVDAEVLLAAVPESDVPEAEAEVVTVELEELDSLLSATAAFPFLPFTSPSFASIEVHFPDLSP